MQIYMEHEENGTLLFTDRENWSIRINRDNVISLYEIPSFGGDERFSGIYPTIQSAIKEAQGWT